MARIRGRTTTGCRQQQLSRLSRHEETMNRTQPNKPTVDDAEKAVGTVLEDLEKKTGGEVTDISLEDVVDTDPATGAPVVEKAVEIELRDRPKRKWST
jgi:hypothetical protein